MLPSYGFYIELATELRNFPEESNCELPFRFDFDFDLISNFHLLFQFASVA
jgi:hypothetical protein